MTFRGYKIDILVQLYSLISSFVLPHGYISTDIHTQVMTQSELSILGNFNVSIIGPSGVGKTTFIQKHATGDFISEYTPTTTPLITPIKFRVVGDDMDGIIQMNVLDHAHSAAWGVADAAIFMFDLPNLNTLDAVMQTFQLFRDHCPTTPTIVVGNKYDLFDVEIPGQADQIHSACATFDAVMDVISCKTNFDYEMPFLYLIHKLMGNYSLVFEEIPVVAPPIVQIDLSSYNLALQELLAAGVTPLPDLSDIEENDLPDLVSSTDISDISDLPDLEPANEDWSDGINWSGGVDYFSSDDEFD